MECLEFVLRSIDKTRIYLRVWKPEKKVNAVVLMSHDIGEHGGRYEQLAEKFCKNNISFIIADTRGHGKSGGKRGHAKSFDILFEDLNIVLKKSVNLFPEIPIILYGQGFGGNLIMNFYLKQKPKISGLVITSPWIRLEKNLNHSVINKIFTSLPLKTKFHTKYISPAASVEEVHYSDPLNHSCISYKLYTQTQKFGNQLLGKAYKFNVPLLIMHGRNDVVTSCAATERFVQNVGHYTFFKFWNEPVHDLHNGINHQEVFTHILNWINSAFIRKNKKWRTSEQPSRKRKHHLI